MYQHVRDQQFYEDMYDRLTVEWGRRDLKYFLEFRKGWFEIMPDEKEDSFRSVFHLNWIYMMMCGNDLVDRYYKRDETIAGWIAKDEAKDQQIADARLKSEPVCQHCGKQGLRITDKSLMNRRDNDKDDKVLFMLRCPHCDKNSAYWEDGSEWERIHTRCPKCQAIMKEKSTRLKHSIKTTYTCPSCGHSYQDKLDFASKKKEKPDPEFEQDLVIFYLRDKKSRDEHIAAKQRFEGLLRLCQEMKEERENKHIYDAINGLNKLKIPELSTVLSPVLEKAGYTEFRLDQPNIGREVTVGFSCLDSKTERSDYDSRKVLKKTVNEALEETNWRLTSGGISYRLGYLSGDLRAYESKEDIKQLVMKSKKLIDKQKTRETEEKTKKISTIKGKDGREIIL